MNPTVPFLETQQPMFMPAPRAVDVRATRDAQAPAKANERAEAPRSFRETMQRTVKEDNRPAAPARKAKARHASDQESDAATAGQQSQAEAQALRDAAAWMAGAQQVVATPTAKTPLDAAESAGGDAAMTDEQGAVGEVAEVALDGSGAGQASAQGQPQATGQGAAQAANNPFGAAFKTAELEGQGNADSAAEAAKAAVAAQAEAASLMTNQSSHGEGASALTSSLTTDGALSADDVTASSLMEGAQVQAKDAGAQSKDTQVDASVARVAPNGPAATDGISAGERPAVLSAEGPKEARAEKAPTVDTAFVTPAALALAQGSPDVAGPRAGAAGFSAAAIVDQAVQSDVRLQPEGDVLLADAQPQGQADGRASADGSSDGHSEMGAQQQAGGRAALDPGTPQAGAAPSTFSSTVQQVSSAPRVAPTQAVPPTPPAPWEVGTPSVRLDMMSDEGLPVQVHVSVVHQTVYARVVTQQADMQDFLTRNQSKLETQLQQQGLEMGSFVVDSGQQQSQQAWEQWQSRDGSQGMGRAAQGRGRAETGEGVAPTPVSSAGLRSRLHIVA